MIILIYIYYILFYILLLYFRDKLIKKDSRQIKHFIRLIFQFLLYLFQDAKAEFTYAFDSVKKDIICCYTAGCFTEEEFLETIDKCKQASQYVFDFYRNLVKKYANVI